MRFIYPSGSRPLEGFTIKRGVGRGGFGEVYYATSDAGKEVALKLIRRNLEIELRGVSQCLNLKHPNLVSLYDIRQDAHEDRWVVMEFVAGESLDAIIARHPDGLAGEDALACFRQIAAGVAYLHDQGIVHRDLKPGNVFLDEGTFKIGDYGLSKFISASRRSGQTESIGTVHYMAPEIANGRYGKEIDIYALGIILYEMLSGRVPYEGESLGEVLMKHLTAEPDMSIVPEAYRHVVARMLCKNPDERFHTVGEVLAQLEGDPQLVPAMLVSGSVGGGAFAASGTKREDGGKKNKRATGRRAPSFSKTSQAERLMLASDDAVLGGVCGGFARYLGIDPAWIRLAVVGIGFATGFVPVLIPYFIIMCIVPSDVDEIESAREPLDTARSALKSQTTLRLVGGVFRMLLALVFGVGLGLLVGGATHFALGRSGEEFAVAVGAACGYLAAAAMATILAAHRMSAAVKIFVSVLLAAGIGFGAAACLMMAGFTGPRGSEVVLAGGFGVGFLAAGLLLTYRLYTHGGLGWRFFPPLLLGAGAGITVGSLIESAMGGATDDAVMIGAGVGILVFGFTAAMLFLGYFSPARAESRAQQRTVETQAWPSDVEQPSGTAPSRTRTMLVALAVAIGLIPTALFLMYTSLTPKADIRHAPVVELNTVGAVPACSHSGCVHAATVQISEKGAYDTTYVRRHLCDKHARMAAWEASKQTHRQFQAFDVRTGHARQLLTQYQY